MQSIKEDITKQSYQGVYLLYGDEAYLRKQYRDKLRDALVSKDDTMNYHYFEGKQVSFPQIIDLAETMPFLNEYKVIVIENSGACKQSSDQIAAYLSSIPETTILIFVEEEVNRGTKLFKAIGKYGRCIEFQRQTEATLQKWIVQLAKTEGKRIHQEALMILLERTGGEMELVAKELEKLFGYTYGKSEILASDVEAVVSVRVQNRIFDMIHEMAVHNQQGALNLYYDLLELKEAPLKILSLITRQFNLLYQMKVLKEKRHEDRVIAQKIGVSPYFIGKYAKEANQFTLLRLRNALEDCVEMEEKIKSGLTNEKIGVEVLIIQYSTK